MKLYAATFCGRSNTQLLQMRLGDSSQFHAALMNRKATEFIQYRRPVGLGPSSKTCPRCASQRRQETAVRVIPKRWSPVSWIFSLASGAQKLGQPVPDSNLVSELKRAASQQMQRMKPLA